VHDTIETQPRLACPAVVLSRVTTSLRESLQLSLGETYILERELGGGGMSRVFIAEEASLGRKVVVKVIAPELAEGMSAERFRREIGMAARLQHPHIVPLLAAGDASGRPYYTMPYVEGDSLRERMSRGPRLSVLETVSILRDVARALDYAHRKGVVHRDVKPDNVLLAGGGGPSGAGTTAVVADFGIAKAILNSRGAPTADRGARDAPVVPGTAAHALTIAGTSIGTPAYMAPEQIAADPDVDHRADIYAFGCMAYEMLTGQTPFIGRTQMALFAGHLAEAPTPISERRPTLPPALAELIMRCLEKDPADRPQTAGDVVAVLEASVVRAAQLVTPSDAMLMGGARAAQMAESLLPNTTLSASASSERKSIVTLPFLNLSPDPENGFFADGLTEEIIADLSQVRALRVISRTSAMSLKGTTKDARTIGRELGVRFVLEGSVRRAGNALRVTAQLVDAETDEQLWAEKYDGTMDDVFAIQERLARSIVDSLQVTLSPAEEMRIAARPIENVRAYECYLRALHEMMSFSKPGLERALRQVRNGIEIAGENVLLYGTMSAIHALLYVWVDQQPQHLVELEHCARRVFELDPASAHGPFGMGMLAYCQGNMREAVRQFERARKLDPGHMGTLTFLTNVYIDIGRPERAAPLVRRLLEMDPLAPMNHLMAGMLDASEGRMHGAAQHFERAYKLAPDHPMTVWANVQWLASSGRSKDLPTLVGRMSEEAKSSVYGQLARIVAHAARAESDAALDLLTPEFLAKVRPWGNLSREVAGTYALLGMPGEALEWLENAIRRGVVNHFHLSVHPFLALIRTQPGFDDLIGEARREWEEWAAEKP
jgi:eukaryotic-like serine/threonine-protein kinase